MSAKPNPPKRQASATVSSTYFTTATPPIRDEYITPKDSIWGDIIKHETVLDRTWKATWENTLVPREMRPDYPQPRDKHVICEKISFYNLKPSQGIPVKASGLVGWRSSATMNSLEMFKFADNYLPEKKRFVQEQFGHYRHMKYTQEGHSHVPSKYNSEELPDKSIRHTTKVLLC